MALSFVVPMGISLTADQAWADEAREDRHDVEIAEVKISKQINADNID